MSRNGKIILAVVLIIVIPGGIALAFLLFARKPKISIEEVNYLKDKFKDWPQEGPAITESRYVDYKMSAAGHDFSGRKFFDEKGMRESNQGSYKFIVETTAYGFYLQIWKNNEFVKGTKVNLMTQTISETTTFV